MILRTGESRAVKRRLHERRYPGPHATHVPIWYACEVWGCSQRMLYSWRVRGLLPADAFIGSGRGTRIRRDVIETQPARSA
jgi:hypothetical protein